LDGIGAWLPLRIKKLPMEEAVQEHMNIILIVYVFLAVFC
jgi:hypothetical protein